MANILAAQNGNWSATSTWTGGVVPGTGDVAIANNKTVTIDQDVSVVALANTADGGATAGGYFQVTSVTGTRTITCSEGIGNTTATNRIGAINGLLRISATSGTVAIVGSVWGGPWNVSGLAHGVAISGTCTVTISGSVGATAAANNGHGVSVTGAATVTIGGNATGGGVSGNGVAVSAAATVTIAGAVEGGAGAVAVYSSSAASILDIGGNITATTASAGVSSTGLVRVKGTLTSASNGKMPVYCDRLVVKANEPVTLNVMQADNWPYTTGIMVPLSNALDGVPATANVRHGTVFGGGGTLTGTLRVPNANQVAAGVPTDNTTGTAALLLADVAAVTGAQIAGAVGA